MKQPNTQTRFQTRKPLASDGDRNSQAAGGTANRAMIDHAKKQAEVFYAVHGYSSNHRKCFMWQMVFRIHSEP